MNIQNIRFSNNYYFSADKANQNIIPSMNNKNYSTNLNYQPNNIRPLMSSISFGNLNRHYDKVMMIILDGFGESADPNSPVNIANTPFLDSLDKNQNGYTLKTSIGAAGKFVGLDDKEVGNSEVGHSNLGTGRKVEQAMTRIDRSIEDGSFKENKAFLSAINHAKENNSTLHIMGALGYSHTHTKYEHYVEMIKMAKENGIKDLAIHIFTNGEGPTQTSSLEFVENLNKELEENGYPHVATIIGRNIVMDKSGKWDRIETAYDALTDGKTNFHAPEVTTGLKQLFDLNVQGLEMPPIISDGSKRIKDNDAVIFANYRADRAIEITSAMTQGSKKAEFMKDREPLKNLHFVTMTRYADDFDCPVAFDNPVQEDTLLEILSKNGFNCSTVAQQEKSKHVGFFFNGSREKEFSNVKAHVIDANSETEHIELNLPKVTEQIIEDINSPNVNFILTNFANSDIIGHKGNRELAIKGIEKIDEYVQKCVEEAERNDIAVIITADHGNIEEPEHTKHTKNKVPCYLILPKHKTEINKLHRVNIVEDTNKALQDIAPTVLDIFGLDKSDKMTGNSLLVEA